MPLWRAVISPDFRLSGGQSGQLTQIADYRVWFKPENRRSSHLIFCSLIFCLDFWGSLHEQDLKAYQKEIERLLREHPDGQLYRSLPGAGATLAARLLAEIGDDRNRYATANSLQCEAGTAPVTQTSGKTLSVVKFRRACKKQLRHALHLFAGCSLPRCAWAQALYAEQRKRGKRHAEALRVVAHKWLKIIFAMRISNTLYDEQQFLTARVRFAERAA